MSSKMLPRLKESSVRMAIQKIASSDYNIDMEELEEQVYDKI
jgi:hypothetical protein